MLSASWNLKTSSLPHKTEATMTFIRDDEGKIAGLLFKQYNRERKAAKTENGKKTQAHE